MQGDVAALHGRVDHLTTLLEQVRRATRTLAILDRSCHLACLYREREQRQGGGESRAAAELAARPPPQVLRVVKTPMLQRTMSGAASPATFRLP